MQWAIGVTTVPERRSTTLPKTLASLRAAGFPPPRLFLDGASANTASSYHAQLGLDVTSHHPRLGLVANWWLAAVELYASMPWCDSFAVFQDDCTMYKDLYRYMSHLRDDAYYNMVTHEQNEHPGRIGWYESNQRGLGAVALAFSRRALQTLLRAPHMVDKLCAVHNRACNIDGAIVEAMKAAGCVELVHMPSLVQHHGSESTVPLHRYGRIRSYMGDEHSALEFCSDRRIEAGGGDG